jgi:hypothetical protein
MTVATLGYYYRGATFAADRDLVLLVLGAVLGVYGRTAPAATELAGDVGGILGALVLALLSGVLAVDAAKLALGRWRRRDASLLALEIRAVDRVRHPGDVELRGVAGRAVARQVVVAGLYDSCASALGAVHTPRLHGPVSCRGLLPPGSPLARGRARARCHRPHARRSSRNRPTPCARA